MTSRPPQSRRPGSAPRRPDPARTERVAAVLAPAVESAGLELEDVELRTVGRRLVLRVLVDSDHGVTLDEVATASHAVAEALDTTDVLGDEPYTLEVSSPGVDRPLTAPRHWRRNVGRLVAVVLTDGRETTGRLLSVSDDAAELEVNVKGRISRTTVVLADVRRAVVQVEFSRVAEADLGDETDLPDDTTDGESDDGSPRRLRRHRQHRRRERGLSAMDIDVSALKALVREKEISYDVVVETIEPALLLAYHHTEGAADSPASSSTARPGTSRSGPARRPARTAPGLASSTTPRTTSAGSPRRPRGR